MTPTPAPDLTVYHVVHRGMRNDAQRLARAVTTIDPGEHRRADATVRWYQGYLGELHDHHVIEDEVFFPALVEKVPVVADLVPRVDREHALLDELLERTDAALRALADGGTRWTAVKAEAEASTRALAELIRTHLAFEDDDIVPLFTRHFTAEEYEELEKGALGNPNLRQLLFTIPWVISAATDEERDRAFATTPFVFKLMWSIRRRPYRRLADTVFAGVPAVVTAPSGEVR